MLRPRSTPLLAASLGTCLALTAPAAAQALVSPAFFHDVEGSAHGAAPFAGVLRHQQIHGDLRGTPRTIRGLAFRRDGIALEDPRYAARSIDTEVRMADATRSTVGAGFATNYLSAPVVVLPRSVVALPSRVPQPRSKPAPFDVALPLAAPFAYSGQHDLLWEVAVRRAPTDPYPSDVAVSASVITHGSTVMNGLGCATPAGHLELHVSCDTDTLGGRPRLSLLYVGLNASGGGSGGIAFGATNPSLNLPGLCTKLHVDPLVVLPVTWDPSGTFRALLPMAYSNAPVGQTHEVQALRLDRTAPGNPLRLTNGVTARINSPSPPFAVTRLTALGDAAAARGTLRAGSGVVVRFDG